MNISELKDQVCDICHKMWQLGWVAANDGNVSVKLDDGTFLVTPTGISKSFITPEKLLIVAKDGAIIEGAEGYKPSSAVTKNVMTSGLSYTPIRLPQQASPWLMYPWIAIQ